MSKENVEKLQKILKETGESLKQEVTRRGLDKDKSLVERVRKIDEGCKETSEYLKQRSES